MTQEFVSVMDDGEGKLNQEIDDLLEGIDFQKSLSQENSETFCTLIFSYCRKRLDVERCNCTRYWIHYCYYMLYSMYMC